MKIAPNLDFTVVKASDSSLNAFTQMLAKQWKNLARAINGNVGFGDGVHIDNVSGVWINVITPGTPNTDFTLVHNLGRVPVGYIPMTKTSACDVYTGSVPATKTNLTLRATVAGVTINFFIL